MARRLIDISAPLHNDGPADPPGLGPTIEYIDHQQSLPQILPFFPGLKREDLPDGQGWAVERVRLSTHNGTHLDAPWHYHPTMNDGERAWTIDDVPLEGRFQNGVKLDFRDFPDGYVATVADVDGNSRGLAMRSNRSTSCSSTPAPGRSTDAQTMSPRAAAWAPRRRSAS
jgi:kynurenine formamidase